MRSSNESRHDIAQRINPKVLFAPSSSKPYRDKVFGGRSRKRERRPKQSVVDDAPSPTIGVPERMDPLEPVVRVGKDVRERTQFGFTRGPGGSDPGAKIVGKLSQLDAHFMCRNVHDTARSPRVGSRLAGPIEDCGKHLSMEIEQIDIARSPD